MRILKITGALLVLAFSCVTAFAQNLQEVVYLKNGSVIYGTIIEQKPNESLKIKTKDGNIFVYQMTEIDRIAKEEQNEKQYEKTPYPNKGYRGFAEIGVNICTDDNNIYSYDRVSVSIVHGCQFNSKFFLGGGFAVQTYFDIYDEYAYYIDNDENYFAFPFFLVARWDFLENKVSPFIDLRIGATVGDIEGAYLAPTVGIRLRRANFSIGYEVQEGTFYKGLQGDFEENMNAVMLKLSMDWGARKQKTRK